MSDPVVVSDPLILGGTPVFAGTRIPVSVLFANLAAGHGLERILEGYPSLRRDHALAVLKQAQALVERDATARRLPT